MALEIDHFVLGAANLEQGVAYISERCGVKMPKGGEHLQMGTHNHVMSLGDICYFEIIAIAPHLKAPKGPRWFDLDNPKQQARIAERPRILTWVARTENLENTLSQTSNDFGEIVAMQRGDLTWKISIREDGSLPQQGLCPSIIEWKNNAPPLTKMADLRCRFENLSLESSEQVALTNALTSIGADHLVHIEPASNSPSRIKLEIATPRGSVMLD